MGLIGRVVRLRLNRRYFWAGFALMALGAALAGEAYPWVLNGGFVLPWALLHGARLHDLGLRGVWAMVAVSAVLAALIGLVGMQAAGAGTVMVGVVAIASFLALALFTLWAGLRRGDPG